MTARMPRARFAFVAFVTSLAAQHSLAARAGTAVLEPTSGSNVKGEVTFSQDGSRVRATGEITGLTPGRHGLHLHEKRDCKGSDAARLFTPDAGKHGSPSGGERQVGDFGNVTANRSGAATVDTTLTGVSLASLMGKGIAVHAKANDEKSDPAGNAGARVACGVVK